MDSLPRERGSSLEHHDWKAGVAATSATRCFPLGIVDRFCTRNCLGWSVVGQHRGSCDSMHVSKRLEIDVLIEIISRSTQPQEVRRQKRNYVGNNLGSPMEPK